MKVGDLVRMDFKDWTDEDIAIHENVWGVGIVLEDDGKYGYCHVAWSGIGPSWETYDSLRKINESW